MKQLRLILMLLLVLCLAHIIRAQDTVEPLVDFFENLGIEATDGVATNGTATDTDETTEQSSPPYENGMTPPFCTADGTDGFPPCGSRYDNECFPGGELEGKCDTTDVNFDGVIETWEQDFMWAFGWSLTRLNQGLITREEFPIESMLPPPPEGAEGAENISGLTCLDSSEPSHSDIRMTAPLNQFHNAVFTTTASGACVGNSSAPPMTVVQAPTNIEAFELCFDLNSGFLYVEHMVAMWNYAVPADWWFCW